MRFAFLRFFLSFLGVFVFVFVFVVVYISYVCHTCHNADCIKNRKIMGCKKTSSQFCVLVWYDRQGVVGGGASGTALTGQGILSFRHGVLILYRRATSLLRGRRGGYRRKAADLPQYESSTLHTPHYSAFRIPHSAFRIPHSAFRIPHYKKPLSFLLVGQKNSSLCTGEPRSGTNYFCARLHILLSRSFCVSLPQSFVAASRRQNPAPSSEGAEGAPAPCTELPRCSNKKIPCSK